MHIYTMENKSQRLLAIQRILNQEKIANQEELTQRLIQLGFDVTQATVSRDLKFLQAGKRADPEGGSVLYIPGSESEDRLPDVDSRLLAGGIKSIHFANQFGVIRTIPGYANSIAVYIDNASRFEIIGTIAGDDTILLIPEQDVGHSQLKQALQWLFPSLSENIYMMRRR